MTRHSGLYKGPMNLSVLGALELLSQVKCLKVAQRLTLDSEETMVLMP